MGQMAQHASAHTRAVRQVAEVRGSLRRRETEPAQRLPPTSQREFEEPQTPGRRRIENGGVQSDLSEEAAPDHARLQSADARVRRIKEGCKLVAFQQRMARQ
jgi:hypothetical protein